MAKARWKDMEKLGEELAALTAENGKLKELVREQVESMEQGIAIHGNKLEAEEHEWLAAAKEALKEK
jgi:hypothetical protein